ncbi:MAG: acyltransferase [Deltaproteobacteria bacterium]|nr:acyltransferase [Deltaproteobacteria bacterium]
MELNLFKNLFAKMIDFLPNPFHPLVLIKGTPKVGKGVYIGAFSEVNAKGTQVKIGNYCDIASFVTINAADSHLLCIGKKNKILRKKIELGKNVFVGSHCAILGGAKIGHHSVIAAGTVVRQETIPPYSLVIGNPAKVYPAYYKKK